MMQETSAREHYAELQTIHQQIQQLHQQSSMLEEQRTELLTLSKSLDELDTIPPKTKMFAPLGGGIYVEGILQETKKVLTAVGSEVMVKKTIVETKEEVEKQIDEVQQVIVHIENKVRELMAKGQQLYKQITAEEAGKAVEKKVTKPSKKEESRSSR